MANVLRRFFSAEYMLKPSQRTGEPIPTTKEVYKRHFDMTWPCAIESVLVSLIGSIDTMMVGGLGAGAIAAVGITNQPKFILLAVIFSLNAGVTAVVARRKGQKDPEGANRCLRQAMIISMVLSIVLSCLGFIFAEPLLRFAGAGDDIIADATVYFQILVIGNVFMSQSLTINAAQRGAGNTKISMRTNIAANIVNVVFNFLLINGIWFFPQLGVTGAAIATALGNVVAWGMSVFSLFYKPKFLDIHNKVGWRFDRATTKALVSVGGSAMVEQVFMRVGFFTYAKIVAELGTVAFATHQICMNILNFSFSFSDGLNIATTSLVGQSLGAKRPDMAIVYGKTGQRMAFIVSTVLCAIFLLGRNVLVGLFTTETAVIELGGIIMIIIAATTHIQTSQIVFSGCLRGSGDTKYIALVSFWSIGIIRPCLSWVLCYPLGMGLVGAWLGLWGDQALRLLLSWLRFRSGKWTKIVL